MNHSNISLVERLVINIQQITACQSKSIYSLLINYRYYITHWFLIFTLYKKPVVTNIIQSLKFFPSIFSLNLTNIKTPTEDPFRHNTSLSFFCS